MENNQTEGNWPYTVYLILLIVIVWLCSCTPELHTTKPRDQWNAQDSLWYYRILVEETT